MSEEAFLARPSPRDLRLNAWLCASFFLCFELTYIFTNYVTGLHHFRIDVHSTAELGIPFVPAMALVYISLTLMLALAPFVLRTWREITPLCVVMTAETLICASFFLLLPAELAYAPQLDSGEWSRFCLRVSAVSLQYNTMPSLHVAFAFTAAMAFGARCGALGRVLLLLWASAIACSTLLIHQHHLADVAAGIALAVAMQRVYRWSADASRLDALRLELKCLAEFRHFVLRHRRYLFTLLVIYKYSLGRWRQTRIIRAGYCLAQHVDDVLDGDRDVGCDPEECVRELLRHSSLARYVVTELRADKGDLFGLFDLLLFDHRRRKDRLTLTAEELREHHRRTFYYSLNLTLIVCGAELRAADAGELISALAWCSVMRDLDEDLNKGLINIPAEVLEEAATQGAAAVEYGQLVRTEAVRNWMRAEYGRGLAAMEQCAARLKLQESRKGAAILNLFLRAIRVYARKYARQNRDILAADTMPGASLVNGYQWLTRPYSFLDAQRRRRGLTFQLDLPILGCCLVTGDPALVREIAVHPDLDSGRGIVALRAILGDRSLITLDGQEHRERRRLLAPAFTARAIEAYDAITIDKAQSVIRELGPGKPFSFYEAARRISLSAIVRFIFGEKAPEEERSLEVLVEQFLASFQNPLVLYLKFLQVDLGRASPWGRALRNRDRLRARIRREIVEQRNARKGSTGSLLASVAGHSDNDPSDDDLTTEVLTLLMFGHDTGAAAMAWVMAHLLAHPEAIERARVDGGTYLEACIQESMRLCPVVVNLTRVARRDLEIGGYRVQEGERVLPCAYLAHHNEEVFPDPERFAPERFLERKNYGYAYFPFGIGARLCLGEPFAMRQMMLILSTFLTQAALEFAPGYQPHPVRNLVLIMPRRGTLVVNRAISPASVAAAGLVEMRSQP